SSASRVPLSFPTRRSSDLTWTTLACGAANLGQLSVARLPAQPAALLLWAVMMEDHTTLGQWIGVAAISALVWSHYVLRAPRDMRSEEHTSELQSRENLVCR